MIWAEVTPWWLLPAIFAGDSLVIMGIFALGAWWERRGYRL